MNFLNGSSFSDMLPLNAVWTTSRIWNSNIIELWISQQGRNSLFFSPTTMNSGLLPLSMNSNLPLSMNSQCPPCLNEWPASSLSHTGILPLLMNSLVLSQWMSGVLPLSMNGFPLWQWPCPSLAQWACLPWWTASTLLWWAASPLPWQTVSRSPQQTASSLPQWTVSSLNKCSLPVHRVDWLWVNTTVIVRVIGYTPPSYYT